MRRHPQFPFRDDGKEEEVGSRQRRWLSFESLMLIVCTHLQTARSTSLLSLDEGEPPAAPQGALGQDAREAHGRCGHVGQAQGQTLLFYGLSGKSSCTEITD